MLTVGAVVVAAGGALGLARRSRHQPSANSTDATMSTGTASPDGVVRIPDLPVPEELPADPYAPTPDVTLGTIRIDRIGLTTDLREGMTLTVIDRGPAHWPGTAMPGAFGNVVVAGHRSTYTRPFSRLDELQPGDPVVFTTPDGSFTYLVRGVVIVPGEAIDIAAQSYAHTATLFACHPPGSATQRIVAKLRLVDADGTPADNDSALPRLDAGTQAGNHLLGTKPADPLAASAG